MRLLKASPHGKVVSAGRGKTGRGLLGRPFVGARKHTHSERGWSCFVTNNLVQWLCLERMLRKAIENIGGMPCFYVF